jgi:Uma2 family endonuclease
VLLRVEADMATSLTWESPPSDAVPALEPGDHLTWPEFERRYEAMPEVKKAELIRGVVYMPSPVKFDRHSEQDNAINSWLHHYKAYTPGVRSGGNSTIRLDAENAPQPDSLLILEPSYGGQCRIDKKGYLHGAPELAVEIASSSVSFDLGAKKDVYLEYGVKEYLVWRVLDNALDWFINQNGAWMSLPPDAQGVFKSQCFPGLWLASPALLRGDARDVLETLQRGLDSNEHAEFVQRLSSRRSSAS